MKKIEVPVNSPRLKSKVLLHEIFIAKIITLIVSGKDVSFRKEFSIPRKGFSFNSKEQSYSERDKWILDPETGKPGYNCDRYINRLDALAREFGFKASEMISLEEYIQTGSPNGDKFSVAIGGGNSKNIEKEKKDGKPTRSWETASLSIRIFKRLKLNKSYKEIAEYYNQILKSISIVHIVTPETLRKITSNANKRMKSYVEKRNRRQEEILR